MRRGATRPFSLVGAGAGIILVPRLAARNSPAGVHLVDPAEPVTRRIFTVSRRGGKRKPAVRVILDALAAEAAGFTQPATTAA